MLSKCPGSSKFRQPEPEEMKCPFCNRTMEIWTDEVKATCPHCNVTILRESDATCLDWCKYAKECVGGALYNKYMKNKAKTIKQQLLGELEAYFGSDQKRVDHAKKVLHFAEELLKREKADWHIVIPASILHDVGIKQAEKKYGSASGKRQEKEGPAVARTFLLKLGLKKEDIDEICEIIAHHHSPGEIATQNFNVLYDADWLVNLKDEVKTKDKVKLEAAIDNIFLTRTGKELARTIYL